jgi:hypothetical protein
VSSLNTALLVPRDEGTTMLLKVDKYLPIEILSVQIAGIISNTAVRNSPLENISCNSARL